MMYRIVECFSAHKPSIATDIAISTEDSAGWSMLGSSLTYVHLGLYSKYLFEVILQ